MTFVWAGGFSFGKITDGYEALKKIVDNPPSNVKFIGIVDRSLMNDVYNMASVLFMPSYNELFPMSILEAMNCQVPMLLRDIEIYESILGGYYLKADNNKGFSDHLRTLALDELAYKKAVKQSMEGSVFYSKEHVLSMWQGFYQEVYMDKVATVDTLINLTRASKSWQGKKVSGQ